MANKNDLIFIGRQWETVILPKEKKYLLKYFKTPVQKTFLKYFYLYGEYSNFVDHTGFKCQLRWLDVLASRLKKIETAQKEARKNMDMATLTLIEQGKYEV